MYTEPKTINFFDNDFRENLPLTLPEKSERIKAKLNELCHFWNSTWFFVNVCDEMLKCVNLLRTIKKQHKLSFDIPDTYRVPEEIKGLDRDYHLLINTLGSEGIKEVDKSLFRLKQCVTDLAERSRKEK
jgi:hypothetical protein